VGTRHASGRRDVRTRRAGDRGGRGPLLARRGTSISQPLEAGAGSSGGVDVGWGGGCVGMVVGVVREW